MIGTNDLEKAKAFYDALLGTLGVRPAKVDGHRIFYFTKTGVFSGVEADQRRAGDTRQWRPPSALRPNSPEQADAWHAAGIANGGKTLRKSARAFAKAPRRQTLSRLSARSRRQQDLRDAPDTQGEIVGVGLRST